jgi:hypothetical protein
VESKDANQLARNNPGPTQSTKTRPVVLLSCACQHLKPASHSVSLRSFLLPRHHTTSPVASTLHPFHFLWKDLLLVTVRLPLEFSRSRSVRIHHSLARRQRLTLFPASSTHASSRLFQLCTEAFRLQLRHIQPQSFNQCPSKRELNILNHFWHLPLFLVGWLRGNGFHPRLSIPMMRLTAFLTNSSL